MWSAMTFRLGSSMLKAAAASFMSNGFEQVLEQVDFVVAVNMLHNGGHAFQAHLRYRRTAWAADSLLPCSSRLNCMNTQFPNFDPAVAVFFGAAGNAAPNFFAVVVENFGAGAAKYGVAHLPSCRTRISRLCCRRCGRCARTAYRFRSTRCCRLRRLPRKRSPTVCL